MLHKTKHYWYQYQKSKNRARHAGNAFRAIKKVLSLLSRKPENAVNKFDQFIAFLSTPFKRLGVFGWKPTGKIATATGRLIRKAVRSSDGFWTLDVRLTSLTVKGIMKRFHKSKPRFIRIEVEPGTRAHAICEANAPKRGHKIQTVAPVVVDFDGPFLELHPKDQFKVSRR